MKNGLFLLCFLMLLKPALPVVDYVINYEYISKVLCVNKSKPAMHCNGKCHLMKELAKASEAEKPLSSDKKNAVQELEILFFEPIKPLVPTVFRVQKLPFQYHYANDYAFLSHQLVFHPPSFIS